MSGPGSIDGVSHDEDLIYVWLNPTIDLALSSTSVKWTLDDAQSSHALIEALRVGWLNGHVSMPTGVAQVLQAHGITPADYADIAARDPLWKSDGTGILDPPRFVPVGDPIPV